MALKQKYSDSFGCDHPDAYWRLGGWGFDLAQNAARIDFLIYHDEKSRRSGKSPFPQRVGFDLKIESNEKLPGMEEVLKNLDDGGMGIRKYLYGLAHRLPELGDAEDC